MDFKGVIIEESLKDKEILKSVTILNTEVEKVTDEHQTSWLKRWTLHTIIVPEEMADKFAKKLSESLDDEHNWYADFKNDSTHYIIFKNKVFKIDRKRNEYEKVVKYGSSLGIPDYQLDFSSELK
ncbi:MAG: hypothetical protein WC393_02420 [Candidatus Nanoarchaeia archaeon]|jgi:hypothetical protein